MVVGLGRAPFLMTGAQVVAVSPVVPARSRVCPAAIGHIGAEKLVLVGDDDDLIIRVGDEVLIGAGLLARRDGADVVAPPA